MNAIQITNLTKSFRGLHAVDGLNMNVPVGAIYGFIGENGSGKSTTQKLICGHLVPNGGEIRLFNRPYTDPGVRARVGALIENAGCFPESTVFANLMMQAINLGIKNPKGEIERVLKIVRMDDSANIKFKSCSLGMKQRVGIAMALLGDPALLILDEPINGLDADGMRIMREVLVDVAKNDGRTVLISSHILGELEKIATYYGIIRQGKMIKELSAEEMRNRSQSFVSLECGENTQKALDVLNTRYKSVRAENEQIIVYDVDDSSELIGFLYNNGITVSRAKKNKVGLEEYYVELMSGRA